jgi:hypothetical protein
MANVDVLATLALSYLCDAASLYHAVQVEDPNSHFKSLFSSDCEDICGWCIETDSDVLREHDIPSAVFEKLVYDRWDDDKSIRVLLHREIISYFNGLHDADEADAVYSSYVYHALQFFGELVKEHFSPDHLLYQQHEQDSAIFTALQDKLSPSSEVGKQFAEKWRRGILDTYHDIISDS